MRQILVLLLVLGGIPGLMGLKAQEEDIHGRLIFTTTTGGSIAVESVLLQ